MVPEPPPINIAGFGKEIANLKKAGRYVNWMAELGEDSLWVPDSHAGVVERIDLATNPIVAAIKIGNPAKCTTDVEVNGLAVSEMAVWVAQCGERAIG